MERRYSIASVPARRRTDFRAVPGVDSRGVGSTRDPDIQALADHLRQADLLDPAELRELIPSVLILESVAVRESPPFDAETIAALRAANHRLLDSAGDPTAAALADDEFHRRLTAGCNDAHLLELVDLVRKALLGAERLYMGSTERLERSVGQHEAIVAALESGDHVLAAERLRENFTSGLPALEQLTDPDQQSAH
jgi:DNA-binding GntR family transcriptional regulator